MRWRGVTWSVEGPGTEAARPLWERAAPPGRMGETGKRTGVSRLGWMDLPDDAAPRGERLRDELLAEGFRRLVVVGMGGAGLSSVTVTSVLPREAPGLEVRLLATLDPDGVREALAPDDLPRTVFLIASRSGTTVETRALESVIADAGVSPGRQLLAVTEPGSPLEAHALGSGYRQVFHGHPRVGGRFAALDTYGLLPAVLAGCAVRAGLDGARKARRELDGDWPHESFRAGGVLAALAAERPLRLQLTASPPFDGVLPWLEQLLAESLGKEGKGILPVTGHDAGGAARVRIGDGAPESPAVHSRPEPAETLGELFRWQVAIGVGGALMGIDPYDQPDIDGAKARARELRKVSGPVEIPAATEGELAAFLREDPGAGLVLNAFVGRNPGTEAALEGLRLDLGQRLGALPALAWGPGLLHSFGQLQKGGPPQLGALVVTWGMGEEIPVPGGRGLGELMHLLALADYQVLRERGRPVCWVHDPAPGAAGRKAVLRRIRNVL